MRQWTSVYIVDTEPHCPPISHVYLSWHDGHWDNVCSVQGMGHGYYGSWQLYVHGLHSPHILYHKGTSAFVYK